MEKKNHVSIRVNPTGSYKMRIQVFYDRHYSGVRVQLGLMTKDVKLAVLRARTVWYALKCAGFHRATSSTCSCYVNPSEKIWFEPWNAQDMYTPEEEFRTVVPSMADKRVSSAMKEVALTCHETGEFRMGVTFHKSDGSFLRSLELPLHTSDENEARERGVIVFRALRKVVAKQDFPLVCLHGMQAAAS